MDLLHKVAETVWMLVLICWGLAALYVTALGVKAVWTVERKRDQI